MNEQPKQDFDCAAFLTVPWGEKRELSRFIKLLESLGNPQRSFRAVHVAGTNGKGSTCAYLDSILRTSGVRVGLYTSPSLIRLNERMRIDGIPIDDTLMCESAGKVAEAEKTLGEYGGFDRLTAAAFVAFAARGVEIAVIETGLGGRLDATNAAEAEIAVLTPIGIDHAQWLGSTVELIAKEKCGIIKPHQFVISAPQESAVEEIVAQTCKAQGAELAVLSEQQILPGKGDQYGQEFVLTTGDGTSITLRTPLLGRHQLINASIAAMAAQLLRCEASSIARGIAATKWPARMEFLPGDSSGKPDVLIDGAHNPHAARALLLALNELFPGRAIVMIVAIMGDKDAQGVLDLLAQRVNSVIAVRCTERSLPPESIAKMLAKHPTVEAEAADSIEQALSAAEAFCNTQKNKPLILVTGSLYLAGKVRCMLLGE